MTGAFQAIALAALFSAAEPPQDSAARAAAEKAMRTAFTSSASWRMERSLKGSSKIFVSEGRVESHGATGIVWRTEKPFPSTINMTPSLVVFENEDGRSERKPSELPGYSEINKTVGMFLEGDAQAFSGLFKPEFSFSADGEWRAVFKPGGSAVSAAMDEMEISGSDLPREVSIKSRSAVTRIFFKEEKRDEQR